MKKVLFVIGTMDNGGAERVVSVLSGELAKRGYNVSIITIIDCTINYKLDERVHIVPMQLKGNGAKKNFYRISELRKEIKRSDVVISFLAIVNMATLIAGIGLKKRVILSERNDPAKEPNSKKSRLIRNLMYKVLHCNYFVFQTEDARNYFDKTVKKQSVIIPNPITDLPEVYIGDREKKIVTIARLEPQKNLNLLISSFAKVCDKYPEYTLQIFGRGPQLDELNIYASKLGVENKVKFCGFSNKVHEEIKNAEMYVMSSDYEGISNGMIEALGLGIPTIATDCPIGGARMHIKNGYNGLLVPVGNEKELTAAMFKVIEEPELAKKLGQSAIHIREELDVKKITSLWEDLIEDRINED